MALATGQNWPYPVMDTSGLALLDLGDDATGHRPGCLVQIR